MAETLTRDEIGKNVISHAAKHSDYREALLKDPRKVIETQLNNKLPDGLQVEIVQEPGDTLFIRLPRKITGGSERSGSDLEQIACGKDDSDSGHTTYTCDSAGGGFNTRNEFSSGISLLGSTGGSGGLRPHSVAGFEVGQPPMG